MHHYRVISIIAASIACAWAPATAHGQTTTGTATTTATSVSSTGTTSSGATASTTTGTTGTTATGTAGTTTTAAGTTAGTTTRTGAESESRYLARLESRYPTLASKTNLESLVHGLRTGSAITLSSTQGATSGTSAASTTFTPPTRPMGYGNITRAMTLATRQLAAAGINDPSPQQLQTALMGGTLVTANGSVQMDGVLQLRSQGMGWGQIAHSIGVQPGMGTKAATGTSSVTGTSGTHAAPTGSARSGITTAGGGSISSGKKAEHAAEVRGRGIVTAAGGSGGAAHYRGRGSESPSGPVITASGAAGHGAVHGTGQGAAGIRSHGGKH